MSSTHTFATRPPTPEERDLLAKRSTASIPVNLRDQVPLWTQWKTEKFRVDWRIDGDDLRFAFYHPHGVNAQAGVFDASASRTVQRKGRLVEIPLIEGHPLPLPDSFFKTLADVAHTAFEGYTPYIDTIPEWLVVELCIPGAGSNFFKRDAHTKHFIETLYLALPYSTLLRS